MPNDILSVIDERIASFDNNRYGTYNTFDYDDFQVSKVVSDRVSSDSSERWFVFGFSAWGADAEGNADIVAE